MLQVFIVAASTSIENGQRLLQSQHGAIRPILAALAEEPSVPLQASMSAASTSCVLKQLDVEAQRKILSVFCRAAHLLPRTPLLNLLRVYMHTIPEHDKQV
jgi:hypothetical protein